MTAQAFGIGTFSDGDARQFVGIVVDDHVIDATSSLGETETALSLLERWDDALPELRALATNGAPRVPLADLHPHVPVASRQIFCAGANYRTHVEQLAYIMVSKEPDGRSEEQLRRDATALTDAVAGREPYIFAGLPSALSGARDDIILWGPGEEHDWELELAVVIGRGGRDIPTERAMEHIAGYTISNDVSTRDVLQRPGFPMSDLIMAKNRRTHFPTGPFILPKEFVADPNSLTMTLRVNGEVMQHDTPADTIHSIERLVSYASTIAELYPGDLLLTGSPAGNAAHHGARWLRPGDLVEGEITGLGMLRNRCVAPAA